jgi:hypothetical protein
MVVHVLLLAAGGLAHAFKYSFLLWPSNFNLVLPQLRHLPRVCVMLLGAAAHYEAELRAWVHGLRRRAPPQQQEHQFSMLRAPVLVSIIEISY